MLRSQTDQFNLFGAASALMADFYDQVLSDTVDERKRVGSADSRKLHHCALSCVGGSHRQAATRDAPYDECRLPDPGGLNAQFLSSVTVSARTSL